MQPAYLPHEVRLRRGDIGQGLARHRHAGEGDEVGGMAAVDGGAHLAGVLESADAGAVAGARVDDDVGATVLANRHALGRHDADQRVVHRSRQLAAVDDHLVIPAQYRLVAAFLVLDEVIAALAHGVGEQHAALGTIDHVIPPMPGQRRVHHGTRDLLPGLQVALQVLLRGLGCLLAVGLQDHAQVAGVLHILAVVAVRGRLPGLGPIGQGVPYIDAWKELGEVDHLDTPNSAAVGRGRRTRLAGPLRVRWSRPSPNAPSGSGAADHAQRVPRDHPLLIGG
jgi:hypothetical protein